MSQGRITTLRNSGQEQQLLDLLEFRNLVVAQLYLMSPIIVTKTLFDRVHQSMLLRDETTGELMGGLCFYEIAQHKAVSIIYFVVDSKHQGRGCGHHLMTCFKEEMRKRGHATIATSADTISLNFYYKSGFVEFPRKGRRLERPPLEPEVEDEEEKGAKDKYKAYEPWLDYIEDYYSSVLVVYRIPPQADFLNFREIVQKQKTELMQKISSMSYRNHSFSKEEMLQMLKDHKLKMRSQVGLSFRKQKSEQLCAQLIKQQKQLVPTLKSASKLEQVALLKILRSSPHCWILRMNFIRMPDSFHNLLSNLITLEAIEESVVQDKYRSSTEMCADLTKLFQNLKLFLAHGSNYYQACAQLEAFIAPHMRQVCEGTFDLAAHLGESEALAP